MVTTSIPRLAGPLASAASLLAAAALTDAAGAAHVSVTVTGAEISVQVCQHTGDEQARTAAVAAYAQALGTVMERRTAPGSPHTWIEARGAVADHPVHVWTTATPTDAQKAA